MESLAYLTNYSIFKCTETESVSLFHLLTDSFSVMMSLFDKFTTAKFILIIPIYSTFTQFPGDKNVESCFMDLCVKLYTNLMNK